VACSRILRNERGGFHPPANESLAFVLRPGAWGRVRYNGRNDDWHERDRDYEKVVVNLALGPLPLPRQPFADSPIAERSATVHLWP
jgi:hypothetical protein